MTSRLGRRVLFQLSRPNCRVTGQNAARRNMSSSSHGAAEKSDKPWIIASALVFGSAAVYLLSPPAKAKAHDAQQHSLPKEVPIPATPLPIKDDEGTEVSAKEVESSLKTAFNEDSPKDAQLSEEKEASQAETAPEDSKEEPASESEVPTGADPATAETEQKENPGEEHPGTLQGEENKGAADESEAREHAKSGQDPKQAAEQQ